ncbi:hypothetical protein Rsub_07769 [Raphidocelis subcapitata]|uniref:Protein kinase domain-containing protein n=1 Tax=Raphidocelis subcapitata TaxID=307507 RepID=A0A2V0P652_9CHLO|nr:hypothetical protein Rsub_07769 [Raphidocelis subcapitata]|eukprot:GBF95341.1 hypothetical protein Rsub_07769 [Raphidocelis subcapitata]
MDESVSGGARPVRDAIAAAARFQGARGRLGGVAADIALACGAGGGTRLAAGLVTAYVDWGLGAAPLDFLGLLPRPLSGIRQGLRDFRAVLAGGTQPPALPLPRAAAAEAREPEGQEGQRQEEKAEVAEREGTAAGQGVEGAASGDEEARPARAAADLAARAVLCALGPERAGRAADKADRLLQLAAKRLELLLSFDGSARSGAGDACSAAEAAASAAAEASAAAVAAVERAPSPVDCGTDGPSSGGMAAAVVQPKSSPAAAGAASEGGASAASALSEEGSGPLLIKAISSTSSSGSPTSSSQSGKPELGSEGRPCSSPTASGGSCAAAGADAPAASLSPAAIAPAPAAIPAGEAPQAAAASPPAAAGPAAAVLAAAPAAGPLLASAPAVPQSLQEELRALHARIDQLTHETAWLGAELARAEAAAAPAQRAAEALRLRYHCAGALTLMGESEPGDQLPLMPVRHGSLIGVLGEGSYGTVYVIEEEDGGAPIAVKTLNPTLGCFSEGAIALFAAAQSRGAATVGRLCPALAYLPGTPADRAAWVRESGLARAFLGALEAAQRARDAGGSADAAASAAQAALLPALARAGFPAAPAPMAPAQLAECLVRHARAVLEVEGRFVLQPVLASEVAVGSAVQLTAAAFTAHRDGLCRSGAGRVLLYEWLGDMAAAIDALHAAGVAHSDLKPANFLAVVRGDRLEYRAGDLGSAMVPPLSRVLGGGHTHPSHVQTAGFHLRLASSFDELKAEDVVGVAATAVALLAGTQAPFATASGWHPARPSPEQAKSLLRARCHVQGGGGFEPLQDAEFVALLEHTLAGDASQPRTPAAAWVALWRRAAQQQRAALTPGEAAELEAARRAVSEAGAALASPGAHFQALQRAEARFWAGIDSGAGAPMPPLPEALQFMVLGVGARRRNVVRERVAALLPALEATSPEAAAHLAQWFGCGRDAAGEPQRLPWTSAANGVATFTWCRVASERVAAARDEACGAIELSVLLDGAGLPRWPPKGCGGGGAAGGVGGAGVGGGAGGGHEPVVDEGKEASGRQQALGLGGGGDASGGARPGESPSCYHLPASEDLFC